MSWSRNDRPPVAAGRPLAKALLLAMALCAPPAAAEKKSQGPPNALQGFSQNRDQPVKIQAASLEVRDKEKIATFSGDVQVFQGDTELRCKLLNVFYDDEAAPKSAKAADPGPADQRQIRK